MGAEGVAFVDRHYHHAGGRTDHGDASPGAVPRLFHALGIIGDELRMYRSV